MADSVLTEVKAKMVNMKILVDSLKKEVAAKSCQLDEETNKHKKAEAEVAALQKRIRQLEDELESTETRLTEATLKLEEASKAADESDRIRRTLETRQTMEGDRMVRLTNLLQHSTKEASLAKTRYEEAARKLTITEVELERAESRLEAAESRMRELQSLIHEASTRLKSLQHHEAQAVKTRGQHESRLTLLTKKLAEAESRSKEASYLEQAKQSELIKLEEALEAERLNHANLRKEMENMLNEVEHL